MGNRLQWGNQSSGGSIQYKAPNGNVINQNAAYNAANRTTNQATALRDNWSQLNGSISQEPNGNARSDRYWYTGSTAPFDAAMDYTMDDANRLVAYSGELHDTTYGWLLQEYYSYDGDGRRTDWTSNLCAPYPSSCTSAYATHSYKRYEYVGDEQVAELAQNGTVPVWYVFGAGGEKLYTLHWDVNQSALTVDAYAKDQMGSIREVVKASGETANAYHYDAFGLPQGSTVSLANSYQFASAPLDVTYKSSTNGYTSFYNLKARLYSPQVGRFLTQDAYQGSPWAPWTQNLYVYVGNNPVNYVDPTGHWAVTVGVSGILAVFFGVKGEIAIAFDDDLNGLVASIGASAYNIGAEVEFCDQQEDGSLAVCGVEVGYGSEGWAASAYAAGGSTKVFRLVNLKDAADWLQEKLGLDSGSEEEYK